MDYKTAISDFQNFENCENLEILSTFFFSKNARILKMFKKLEYMY